MKRWCSRVRVGLSTAAIVAGAAWFSGCYTYTPMAGAPAPGDEVRATLTSAAAVRETELRGAVTQHMTGRVVHVANDSVALSVVSARGVQSNDTRTFRQVLTLSQDDVQLLSVRNLSWARTGLVTVLGLGLIALSVGTLEAGGSEGSEPGGGDQTFTPGFRLQIPIGR